PRSVSGAEDAELVALGIGEHDPRLVAGLPDVGVPGTQRQEALDLRFLVVRAKIDVQPVLAGLLVRRDSEQQARLAVGRGTDLEFLVGLVHDHPAQRLLPPAAERDRAGGVDDELLPLHSHGRHGIRTPPRPRRNSRYCTWARSSRLRILPVALRGRAGTAVTEVGHL